MRLRDQGVEISAPGLIFREKDRVIILEVPDAVRRDRTGAVEIRSLLWGWRRTPDGDGEGKDSITFAIPASGLDYEDEDYEDEDESPVEVEIEVPEEA